MGKYAFLKKNLQLLGQKYQSWHFFRLKFPPYLYFPKYSPLSYVQPMVNKTGFNILIIETNALLGKEEPTTSHLLVYPGLSQ